MILPLLREMRTSIDRLSADMHAMREEMGDMRDEMRAANTNAAYAAGLGILARRDTEQTSVRVEALEARVKRLEDRAGA
jgi:outer membrane murein-binding lipoprotein Lpp